MNTRVGEEWDDVSNEAKDLINVYESNKYTDFLKKKIYDTEDCCICLDENPNTVFYQCGHKVIHLSCINKDLYKCPMCRLRISAYLKVSESDDVEELSKELKEKVKIVSSS